MEEDLDHKKYPEKDGKELSFVQWTSKDVQNTGNEDERLPSLRRCERIYNFILGTEYYNYCSGYNHCLVTKSS